MSQLERRLACVLSGQLTERQLAAEMSDRTFAAYHRQRTGEMSMASTKKPAPKPKPQAKPTQRPFSGGGGSGDPDKKKR